MKKIFSVEGLVTILAILFFLRTAHAFSQDQESKDYVTYPKVSGKLSSKRPTFNDNVIVGFTFDGPLVLDTQKTLIKLGVVHFLKDHCNAKEVEICVSLQIDQANDVSSYSSSSGYGRHGGGATEASFSGKLYPITVVVSIVHQNGNGTQDPLIIAHSSELAAVGSGMESMGSYDSRGSGTFTISSTTGLNAAVSNAVRLDLINLVGGGWARGLRLDFISPWVPGANEYVAQAFRPNADSQQ